MVVNLFSIFDPSSSMMNLMWAIMLTPILMNMKMKFLYNSKSPLMMKMEKELKNLMLKKPKSTTTLIKIIFMSLFTMNFMALFPFIFTPTAHISISLPLAMTSWMMIMSSDWAFKTKNMLMHMIPMGTPPMLINFMFMIENASNIIRPITLSIRLSANMVAGHLLMNLLSNFALSSSNHMMISVLPMITLTTLEMAVSAIQAYVFITLVSLYLNEST